MATIEERTARNEIRRNKSWIEGIRDAFHRCSSTDRFVIPGSSFLRGQESRNRGIDRRADCIFTPTLTLPRRLYARGRGFVKSSRIRTHFATKADFKALESRLLWAKCSVGGAMIATMIRCKIFGAMIRHDIRPNHVGIAQRLTIPSGRGWW